MHHTNVICACSHRCQYLGCCVSSGTPEATWVHRDASIVFRSTTREHVQTMRGLWWTSSTHKSQNLIRIRSQTTHCYKKHYGRVQSTWGRVLHYTLMHSRKPVLRFPVYPTCRRPEAGIATQETCESIFFSTSTLSAYRFRWHYEEVWGLSSDKATMRGLWWTS